MSSIRPNVLVLFVLHVIASRLCVQDRFQILHFIIVFLLHVTHRFGVQNPRVKVMPTTRIHHVGETVADEARDANTVL